QPRLWEVALVSVCSLATAPAPAPSLRHHRHLSMDLSSLIDLPILPVRITARALDPVHLPANSASSLRGAFGASLYRLVCAHRERALCAGCPAEATCAYPYLFVTRAGQGQAGTAGFQD